MPFWIWILLVLVLIGALLAGFITIARKGRELRKNQPLPPPAEKAFLQWTQNEKQHRQEIHPPFYFGSHPESNVILPNARVEYVVCIFHHNKRFAAQTLPGSSGFLLNGEDALAGYLRDGDELLIENQKFIFHCY
jgi:hypothetical protein